MKLKWGTILLQERFMIFKKKSLSAYVYKKSKHYDLFTHFINMLMKRRTRIIAPQFFSFTRRVPKGKHKKKYKVIDPHFGCVRPVRHIKPLISKYG